MSFKVLQPGLLSLIQDLGRFGQHNIGLTTGGPLDSEAFLWANRLLRNAANACAIEVSFGGLQLLAQTDSYICITGAGLELTINGVNKALWTSHKVVTGDQIKLGYSVTGCRSYVGVAGGFNISPSFGSSATVVREKIGGLNGSKLAANDTLPCTQTTQLLRQSLPEASRPLYAQEAIDINGEHTVLRLLPGYQHHLFDLATKARFFHGQYTVTDRSDRMGMRLEGPAVPCPSKQMLSEGICLGAVQVPADGQPIVLLNDRQTIGGYPKIGAVIARDTARLAQLRPGDTLRFEAVDLYQAHTINTLAQLKFDATTLHQLKD
ncbi:MAG: biotin-dependent carboxylase-like uncharacterized protein [Oceanospirillaceae bacterium]|jgi:biotin-dependent carboxylase-like uncharacterized protein